MTDAAKEARNQRKREAYAQKKAQKDDDGCDPDALQKELDTQIDRRDSWKKQAMQYNGQLRGLGIIPDGALSDVLGGKELTLRASGIQKLRKRKMK